MGQGVVCLTDFPGHKSGVSVDADRDGRQATIIPVGSMPRTPQAVWGRPETGGAAVQGPSHRALHPTGTPPHPRPLPGHRCRQG